MAEGFRRRTLASDLGPPQYSFKPVVDLLLLFFTDLVLIAFGLYFMIAGLSCSDLVEASRCRPKSSVSGLIWKVWETLWFDDSRAEELRDRFKFVFYP